MGSIRFELLLIWQNPETRQRYHIGTLTHQDDMYAFAYETRGRTGGLLEAMGNGYRPHLAFPDISKVYRSDRLFGPFSRRIPDVRRPDYEGILRGLGLRMNCTEMELLCATGGILATDSYEFVLPTSMEE